MTEDDNPFPINEKEVMEYYGYSGRTGSLKLKTKFLRSWILHSLAYSTPSSGFAVKMQKMRGVKIGRNCHFNPYVLIDLIYPELVNIGDNVTLGSHSMIFAHRGENSIISPRSVVVQDIPDYCIAVGNPARVVKKINH